MTMNEWVKKSGSEYALSMATVNTHSDSVFDTTACVNNAQWKKMFSNRHLSMANVTIDPDHASDTTTNAHLHI
jgi:LEA14-like dessication related protein